MVQFLHNSLSINEMTNYVIIGLFKRSKAVDMINHSDSPELLNTNGDD